MNISKYNSGDKIGECIYINEEPKLILSNGKAVRMAKFACKCGQNFIANISNVKRHLTTSCGCYQKRRVLETCKTHGLTNTKEFDIWNTMIQRCTNKNNKSYEDYGGRGIKVCDEWSEFINFYNDMGERPSEYHSLERIDNNQGYCKENCKWDTKKNQANNRRNSFNITFKGETKTLSNWAEELHMPYDLLRNRLKKLKWPVEEAFTTSLNRENRYLYR